MRRSTNEDVYFDLDESASIDLGELFTYGVARSRKWVLGCLLIGAVGGTFIRGLQTEHLLVVGQVAPAPRNARGVDDRERHWRRWRGAARVAADDGGTSCTCFSDEAIYRRVADEFGPVTILTPARSDADGR